MEAPSLERATGTATQERHERTAAPHREARVTPPLDWKLTRNCSLRPAVFFLNVGALSAFSASAGIAFWLAGYPLILFFCGCKIAALWAAAWAYARHAIDGERVRMRGSKVYVESVCGARRKQFEFHLCWVRLERPSSGELLLCSGGVAVPLGAHLTPARRQIFAAEFSASLAWARQRGHSAAPT